MKRGISSKLNEGLIYRFIKTSIKLRMLQKFYKKHPHSMNADANIKELVETENLFDDQLHLLLQNIDEVDTDRVINAMSRI